MTRFGLMLSMAIAVVAQALPAAAQEPSASPPATELPAAETAPAPVPAEPPRTETPATQPAAAPVAPAADSSPLPTSPAPAEALSPAVPTQAAPPAASGSDASSHEAAPLPSAEALPTVAAAHLPHDLSPWNMFMQADLVVKSVMIGLAFASVVTWTVWLAKSIELTWAKRKLARAFALVASAASLPEARTAVGDARGIVPGLLAMADTELRLSSGIADKAGIKERVASRLDGLTLSAGRDMNSGTGVLATIGSTAPFVGLFGTVWGIMNSFIGISEAQTTNLAVVAPGIAEALLATAIGLVAAIPAVIIYNQFARSIAAYKASVSEVSAEVLRLVSRDLDRGVKAPLATAAE